jgi:hypothetical protein
MRGPAKLMPPTEGITYTLDETFLENRIDERPPVECWLLMNRVIGKARQRFVHEIVVATKAQADAAVAAIAEREDVTLVDDKSQKPIKKTF